MTNAVDFERERLREHVAWSLYPEVGVEAAERALSLCALGSWDTEVEAAGRSYRAGVVVVLCGLDGFLAERVARLHRDD